MAITLPSPIIQRIGVIGYGQIGKSLALSLKSQTNKGVAWVGAWDIQFDELRDLPDEEMERAEAVAKRERQHARDRGIAAAGSAKQLCETATLIISCVPPSAALDVVQEVAKHLPRGGFYLDINDMHLDTQQTATSLIQSAGGHFVAGEGMTIRVNSEPATRLAAALAPLGFAAA
jgi:3-hydroxyisobutyrate dehydrogenase-like beta-hydroxyacid dehydrogenase